MPLDLRNAAIAAAVAVLLATSLIGTILLRRAKEPDVYPSNEHRLDLKSCENVE